MEAGSADAGASVFAFLPSCSCVSVSALLHDTNKSSELLTVLSLWGTRAGKQACETAPSPGQVCPVQRLGGPALLCFLCRLSVPLVVIISQSRSVLHFLKAKATS